MRGGITRIEADFKSMTGAQRKACYMIAQGESYAMVAKKLKVSTRVLARWRSIYEFQSVLRALMIFYADEAFNSINTSLPLVLDSLRDIASMPATQTETHKYYANALKPESIPSTS